MRKDQIFVLLLILLLPMTGCFGDLVGDAQADDDEDDDYQEPVWINDVGTNPINWSLTLTSDQWLEVKSAFGILVIGEGSSQEEITQRGLLVNEVNHWNIYATGFSPIFGGEYTMCGMMIDESCDSTDPNGDWYISDWSIIYRIHSV